MLRLRFHLTYPNLLGTKGFVFVVVDDDSSVPSYLPVKKETESTNSDKHT
jgi:hypothetical protein